MQGKYLKACCDKLAHKISLVIYACKMVSVNPVRVKSFSRRLYSSIEHATTEDEVNDKLLETQEAILEEYTYHSLKMWKFCGEAVMRLSLLIALHSGSFMFSEIPMLQKRMFRSLRKARNNAGVNARGARFFQKVLDGYTVLN